MSTDAHECPRNPQKKPIADGGNGELTGKMGR